MSFTSRQPHAILVWSPTEARTACRSDRQQLDSRPIILDVQPAALGFCDNPLKAFSEMDFNRDGEVSFDEFVRWYSMSSATQQERSQQQQRGQSPPPPTDRPADASFEMDTATAPPSPAPPSKTQLVAPAAASSSKTNGASRLMADLEGLTRASRPRGSNVPQRPVSAAAARSHDDTGRQRQPPGAAAAGAADTGGNEFPVVLAPTAVSSWLVKEASGRRLATEAEKDAFRERWLAGGTADEASAGLPDLSKEAERGGASGGGGGRSAAEEDLEKALQVLGLLVKASADADTLIAALASRMIRNLTGR